MQGFFFVRFIVTLLVKNVPTLYGIRRFITAFVRTLHLSLS